MCVFLYMCPGIQVDDSRILIVYNNVVVSFRFDRLGFGKEREDDDEVLAV